MTSAIPPTVQHETASQQTSAPNAASDTNTSLSGAVPAQLPGRSYASATKTASPASTTPAGAPAPSQNAKPSTESPVNGATSMAQGGPQAASAAPNGTPTEHGRKSSVIISAQGASGSTPNGGPVGQNNRPPISFGMMNQGSPMPSASAPYQSQNPSLSAPPRDPRVISPAHSPSPIPQPPASGGRPPSGFQNQNNGMTFGSMGGESDPMRQNQNGPLGPGMPMHERRVSSQGMHGDPNMNRNFQAPNGRGRGFQGPYAAQSPGMQYRQMPGGPPRPGSGMPPQFQTGMPPGSPYNRGRNSPALPHQQPNMQPQHMSNPQMYGGGYQGMGGQGHPQGVYNYYDPQSGYYPPQWPGQQGAPSPRPGSYPSPFPSGPTGMAPPFYPPNMSRSASQVSERPPSSMGQPATPAMSNAPPSGQPAAAQQASSFVKPNKTSRAIKITNPLTGEVVSSKASATPTASAQPQNPVIVSTPNAPTPPPRTASAQHERTESKSTMTAEEKKRAFQEEVNRRRMGEPAKEEPEAAKPTEAKAVAEVPSKKDSMEATEPAKDVVKEATAETEKAAATDAGDDEAKKDADAAASAATKEPVEETPKEETEDERLEREIAEMEAKEKEEEEREAAYQAKKNAEKAANAKVEAEKAAKADEELKRQEREAEEREEQRERERETGKSAPQEPDSQSKDMFESLKKPEIGPGASAPASGTETPASEDAEASSMPPPSQPASTTQPRGLGAQKPKPAHLKLETSKRVEPAEPTPGMQALKSARFLEIKEEAKYPDGFKSPNPALNVAGARKGRAYDKAFLLQFQPVFKEKPSVDWDQKVRDTLGPGDEPGSARPGSARTPSSSMGRQPSGRPGPSSMASFGGPMGNFGGSSGPRTLPPGTTSQERFQASQQSGRPGMGNMPMGRAPSQFGGMQPAGMNRTNSSLAMGNMVPGSPRVPSTRGGRGGSSRRGDRTMSKKEEAEMASKMPLTAHMDLKPLEKSGSGWKPTSIGQPMQASHDLSGNMAPDMVQRKVKAALNKMTPSTFDKISDQILEIAGQSKNESDGRTLRQVIQLTFEKACDEAHWAEMYARFCSKMLSTMSPDIRDETVLDKAGNLVVGGALFRKYLLNRCQEEFERGWQVNLPEKPEGETQEAALLSDEYYVAAAAKRRGLGLIQFIGQLYKLRMLTLRIMHECVMKLLNFEGDPDESAVENLTTLLRSVGATMESDEQGTGLLSTYFERIENNLLKSDALPSRPKFMLLDLVDLRKANWKGKNDGTKGPKTIDQIHAEAEAAQRAQEAERQRTAQRGGGGRPPAGRGDARNFSSNMPPPDYKSNMLGTDDLRKLQNRNRPAAGGGGLGPGGSLGPGGGLGARAGSRRGNLGPTSSGNTTRTNTPPVEKEKKEEPSSQNAFGALASLDSGEAPEESTEASPPSARNRSKSPLPAEKAEGPTA
ncbi:uncharacterized protein LTR77_005449 [Saxophila tyrrhenica]|uniref:MIF4G domain-containing protein n=1 Tax=Saxophila tyrrhenica TaxID=1690608 RepID=A0AAV9P9A5_9PEZI|nr:hypothetical protein LTR77_005449 [Saxophila tyrrhenica]